MVPQPVRTLDLDRKEELIIQKQIRQSTSRMMKQNLPTLIEASPDFSQKKLPYLPNLPASVQIGEGPTTQTWFDQYPDNSESIATDDIPSLYSVPQKNSRRNPYSGPSQYNTSGDTRPDSRRSRSGSITFDIDEDIHTGSRKNTRKRPKEKKELKEETQATTFAKEHKNKESNRFEEQEQELSMWACRKCTLDNPLQEATCLACGGSRLSSIGDIEVPRMLEPKNIVNLIVNKEQNPPADPIEKEEKKDDKWKCIVCTLENDPLAYYCDACNSQSPHKLEIEMRPAKEKLVLDFQDLSSKFARYFGITCFLVIIIYCVINMVICLYSAVQTVIGLVPEYTPIVQHKHGVEHKDIINTENGSQENKIEDTELENANPEYNWVIEQIFSDILGIHPALMAIFCPVFLYLVTQIRMRPRPRVPQPM